MDLKEAIRELVKRVGAMAEPIETARQNKRKIDTTRQGEQARATSRILVARIKEKSRWEEPNQEDRGRDTNEE